MFLTCSHSSQNQGGFKLFYFNLRSDDIRLWVMMHLCHSIPTNANDIKTTEKKSPRTYHNVVLGKIKPNFNLKNMILTYREEFFHGKNGSNLPDLEDFFFRIARFL
jgi:hypothetical protein